jgi:nucleoside-diphosphate-sugar epimerase
MSVAVVKPWKTTRIGGAQLVIVGCGDVGLRLFKQVQSKISVLALGRTPILVNPSNDDSTVLPKKVSRFARLDLDDTSAHLNNMRRYAAIATRVVYLAPPFNEGLDDRRIQRFLACAASPTARIKQLIYVSTTGVYGTANGMWVNETSPLNAKEPRAIRRIAAEKRVKNSTIPHVSVLRAPGIYADDRLPIQRLKNRLPALIDSDDIPTNHIHADDLARLCWLALFKSANRRTYNVADGVPMMHAQYLKAVAQRFNLPMPIQLPREAVQAALSPIAWSMLSGARRIDSSRLRNEWRIQLKYPSMSSFLSQQSEGNLKSSMINMT